jgi:hypothetical protein
VLSGRGLCDELITHPEESYRLCCVVVCDLETSGIGAPYIYNISNLMVNIFKQQIIFSTSFIIFKFLRKAMRHLCIVRFLCKI